MDSILLQEGDFEIEYIVVDSGSNDGTKDILSKYVLAIKDHTYPIACKGVTLKIIEMGRNGMYAAINRGFKEATGDVYAWLNADDLYAPHVLSMVAQTFGEYPELEWLKGITDTIDEEGRLIRIGRAHAYDQSWAKIGVYGRHAYYIEQDSVFWRAHLWKKIGVIPEHLRYAGDYWLWTKFARHAPLVTLNEHVSYFRKRAGQLSKAYHLYRDEQRRICASFPISAYLIHIFFSVRAHVTRIFPKLDPFFVRLYPILFRKTHEYIDAHEHHLTKKKMPSFIV